MSVTMTWNPVQVFINRFVSMTFCWGHTELHSRFWLKWMAMPDVCSKDYVEINTSQTRFQPHCYAQHSLNASLLCSSQLNSQIVFIILPFMIKFPSLSFPFLHPATAMPILLPGLSFSLSHSLMEQPTPFPVPVQCWTATYSLRCALFWDTVVIQGTEKWERTAPLYSAITEKISPSLLQWLAHPHHWCSKL